MSLGTRNKALVLAVSKGRIYDAFLALLRAHDLLPQQSDTTSPMLLTPVPALNVQLLRVRNWDTPTFVAQGAADLGIVGTDILAELSELELFHILDTRLAPCRICLAQPLGQPLPKRLTIATKYPKLTRRMMTARGHAITILYMYGSHEIAPACGLADAVVDIVDTGHTLQAQHLAITETLLQVSAYLIANPMVSRTRRADVLHLTRTLESLCARMPAPALV